MARVVALKGCCLQNAARELDRIRERYGDGYANCIPINLIEAPERSDLPNAIQR